MNDLQQRSTMESSQMKTLLVTILGFRMLWQSRVVTKMALPSALLNRPPAAVQHHKRTRLHCQGDQNAVSCVYSKVFLRETNDGATGR
jgi:hypothetical protein